MALESTDAGAATAETSDSSIRVTAPFTGDDTPDNSVLIEWDLQGGSWSGDDYGSTLLGPLASPYLYSIESLSNYRAYQVRVTYQDAGGVTGVAVQELGNITPYNSLIHSSVSTGSSKWVGNSGWGIPGGRYGEFVCETCHARSTTNIKRIRASIITPDPVPAPLPGDGGAISLLSAENGTSDFGDDTGGHATSNRICEICHTYDAAGNDGVAKHAYSIPGDSGHFNRQDCIDCHKHDKGFKASCDACHGGGTVGAGGSNYWPDASNANIENDDPARHLAHIDFLAVMVYGYDSTVLLDRADADDKQVELCLYCHDNPGGDGDHGDSANLPAETAFRPIWDKDAAPSGGYAAGDCSNVACHNTKATGTGVYGWLDADASACIMCHNDITDTGTVTGDTHGDHTGAAATFGRAIGCDDCHDAAADWASNVKPAAGHIDGVLDIGGNVSLTYTGSIPPGTSYGGCGNNACHNDGAGGNPANSSYIWSNSNLADCTICHASVPAGGSHAVHVATAEASYGGGADWAGNKSTAGAYDFGCGNCHGGDLSAHLNGGVTVSGVNFNSPGAGQCSSNSCHQDGQGGAPLIPPTWGTPFTAGACNQCHGNFPTTAAHPQHTLEVGFHYNAIYSGLTEFLPVVDADAAAIDQALDDGDGNPSAIQTGPVAAGFDQLRGHGGNLETGGATAIVSCNTCHYLTVTVNTNDLAGYADADANTKACAECHDDSVTAKVGVAAVADKSVHANGAVEVRFIDKKLRSKAQTRNERAYTVVPATGEADWTKTTELTSNWLRFNGYKDTDGSSYDEQPDTLHNMTIAYNGGDPDYYDTGAKTCMISCHLWEAGRVDKIPVHWVDNAGEGSAPLMCIDCHTRLPK